MPWRVICCWHVTSLSDHGRCWGTPPSWGKQAPPINEYKIDGAPSASSNQIAIDPDFGPRAEGGPYKATEAPTTENTNGLHPHPPFVQAYNKAHASHHQNRSPTSLRLQQNVNHSSCRNAKKDRKSCSRQACPSVEPYSATHTSTVHLGTEAQNLRSRCRNSQRRRRC